MHFVSVYQEANQQLKTLFMLKNLLNLEEVKELTNAEQKLISGSGSSFGLCYCASLGYEVDCVNYDHICPLDN